jgi:hypothetical protein
LLVLGSLHACNSPTLPTPPPGAEPYQLDYPDAELTSDGQHVDVSGFAMPGALVIVINRTLLATDIAEASAVTVATLDTGRYVARIRVDLTCLSSNAFDVVQRDDYGRVSPPRDFDAPNGKEDGAVPPSGACGDAGVEGGADASDGLESGPPSPGDGSSDGGAE